MEKFEIQCFKCKKIYKPTDKVLVCSDCGMQLNINLNYAQLKQKIPDITSFLSIRTEYSKSLWKFFDFLPLMDEKNIVSIGEGWTPLIKVNNLSK